MKPFIDKNLPEQEYFDLDALGSTDIRKANKSINHWLHYKNDDSPFSSDSMKLGSLIHQYLLERERFKDISDKVPPGDWKDKHIETALLWSQGHTLDELPRLHSDGYTKSTYKKYVKKDGFGNLVEWCEETKVDSMKDIQGLPSEGLVSLAKKIAEKAQKNPLFKEHFTGGESEVSFGWRIDSESGLTLECKGRADYLKQKTNGRWSLYDIKTTSKSAKPEKFLRVFGRRNYHLQSGWYKIGLDSQLAEFVDEVCIFAIETNEPYNSSLLKFDAASDTIACGMKKSIQAADDISSYKQGEIEYKGYEPEPYDAELKEWEL